jgi:hypothetical protein
MSAFLQLRYVEAYLPPVHAMNTLPSSLVPFSQRCMPGSVHQCTSSRWTDMVLRDPILRSFATYSGWTASTTLRYNDARIITLIAKNHRVGAVTSSFTQHDYPATHSFQATASAWHYTRGKHRMAGTWPPILGEHVPLMLVSFFGASISQILILPGFMSIIGGFD